MFPVIGGNALALIRNKVEKFIFLNRPAQVTAKDVTVHLRSWQLEMVKEPCIGVPTCRLVVFIRSAMHRVGTRLSCKFYVGAAVCPLGRVVHSPN